MSTSQVLHEAAAHLLGPCEVTAVLAGAVARVATASGEEFVVKQHLNRPLHEREVHAYRHWTGVLGSSAPRLVAVDDPAMIIVTSALPGSPGSGDLTPSVYRQAGVLLRRFHSAEPSGDLAWFNGWLRDRADHWTSRAAALMTEADAKLIESHLAALRRTEVPRGGPCHLDFQPRNWLISNSGDFSLVDFEHARIDLPARDFVRLRFRIWAARPELRNAFFDGYGRQLTEAEDQLVWHLGAIDALTALVRGHETGDPELIASGHATLQQLRKQP